ncbi:unnamed protein product [Durusdinium trenchii]|uniref:Uncharacterized protein n=1 Tax=Durusdinium trenchii TaxID=1381693 RepID=A0ABP0SH46_9DINO
MLEVAARLWDAHTTKSGCDWDLMDGYEDRENVLEAALDILWGAKALVVDEEAELRQRRGKLDVADVAYLRCLMRRYGWERSAGGVEVPHVNDPLASAKFPMYAEVTAFQRQSERTEALRREVSTLRQMVDTSAANFKRVAEDSASFAMEKVEASLRLSQLEQLKEMKALLEQALDQREHLASLARDAMEQRLHHELQHVSEVMNANIQALQEAVAKNDQKTVEEAVILLLWRTEY